MGASRILLPRATPRVLLVALGLLLVRCPLPAHAADGFALPRSTIDGGGATFSTGAAFSLGGTIGQADAGAASGGAFVLSGGFWPSALAVATPTPSATASATPTRTATRTAPPTATGVATSSASRTATRTATPSVTRTGTQAATPTASRTPTAPTPVDTESPTPSPTPPPCAGDCDGNQVVAIDELIRGVNVALDQLPLDACPAFDANGDRRVSVNELITAVNNTLLGCPRRVTSLGS